MHCDVRSFGGEGPDDGGADTSGAARDEHALAVESCIHAPSVRVSAVRRPPSATLSSVVCRLSSVV